MEFTFLDPVATAISRAPDNTLRVEIAGDKCGLRIEVLRAFPLSHAEEYVVLRDGASNELGMLRDLRQLPPETADLLREQLRRRYFLPIVQAINSVAERFGSSVWDLQTDRGQCIISTRQMNEAVSEVEPGRYIITDVDSNRYEIKDLSALDDASRSWFLGKL